MQRYDSYKPSGVKWLGEIPSHWEVIPMKYCMQIKNGMDYKQVVADYGYPVIGSGGQFAYASDYMHDGEVVFFGRKGTIDKPLHFKGKFWAVDTMFYAIPKKIYGKFLYYVGLTIPYKYYSTATALPSMTQTDLGNNPICFPPLEEQTAIANYLDTATAKIDAAIAQQQKMIDLLNERKQIIINRAVTKGLNPNAKMKDSGVEWIGEVPEHWEILPYRYLFYNLDKLRMPITADQRSRNNPQYDYYGASGVIDKIDYYNVEDKVLLIGEDGANLLMRNLPLIYKAEGKFWVNNHAHILKPIRDDYDYLAYVMEAADYTLFITGSAQPKLSQANLNCVKLPIPPLEEQKVILDYLSKRTSKIDVAIDEANNMISLLQERNQIIINEVVTGKVRVG